MNHELRIRELVEEALNTGRAAEDVCCECPELVPEVRRSLAQVHEVDGEIDRLLPDGPGPRHTTGESMDVALPRIPGYELKEVLGRGGMGVVYRARHLRLERDVALKMLIAGEFASTRELERFFLEARSIANLSHPNIVQVHDVSEREGRPYFTMELVEGGTLAHWLGSTPQPARRAAETVRCLADAIEVAHRNGIIHRDLKPANVLLTGDGTPKVSDFGLARRMSNAQALTASGAIVGTPSYMAPEQVRGRAVGFGADVYALGAILYEILTGRPPFRSESPLATQLLVLGEDPVRPSLLNDRVPRSLETICLRCLHKDPARRYESAAALADDLRRFLDHEPIRARPVSPLERAWLWVRRNPARSMAIMVAVALIGFWTLQAVRSWDLARARREQVSVWSPRIDEAFERLRSGDIVQARSILDPAPDMLDEEARRRVQQARRELVLVEQLDGIRLRRVGITDGRFDRSENRRVADIAYRQTFQNADLGTVGDDPQAVAARVRAASVMSALLGALDDWAFCAEDEASKKWLLDLAHRSDPAPSPWRERLRDPSLRLEEGSASLAELAIDVHAHRMTVQLLVGAAERMREAGVDVVPLLTLVQRAHPGDFWANFALADVRWQDPGEAIRYAQAAVAIRPRASIAHQALGTALRKAGRFEEGLEAYRRAVQVEPDFAEAHGRLALVLYEADKFEDAIAESREAVRLDPTLAWAHLNLGTALFALSRFDEAHDAFRAAVLLEPRSGAAHSNLGHCLLRLGRKGDAVGSFRRAVELEPTPAHLHDLGTCLEGLNQFDGAEVEYRAVLQLDPAHEASKLGLRTLLVRMGRGQEALDLLRRGIEAAPDSPTSWDSYPELCAYLGREHEHLRACEELLARFGGVDQARVCERIGRACLLLPSNSTLPGAVSMIDRAIRSPESQTWALPYFQCAKALAEYRCGRFESAVQILRTEAGQVLTPTPELIRAMALQRMDAMADARRNLAAAALSIDWSPAAARDQDLWIRHVLRREAQALILPELADLLAGAAQPRDDDTRAALTGALVSMSRDAAAARLYEQLFAESSAAPSREQRHVAARVLARAGVGLGADPADEAERARFRERLRSWFEAEVASCKELIETRKPGWRETAGTILMSWLDDPAFSGVRDQEALSHVSQIERDAWRLAWVGAEALARRLGEAE